MRSVIVGRCERPRFPFAPGHTLSKGRASRPDVAWLRSTLLVAQDVRKSRDVYMTAKKRAVNEPGEILVIAIDGSDQSSYATPYFSQSTKDTEKGWKLRWKLIGALVTNRLMNVCIIGSNWECGEMRPRVPRHDEVRARIFHREPGCPSAPPGRRAPSARRVQQALGREGKSPRAVVRTDEDNFAPIPEGT